MKNLMIGLLVAVVLFLTNPKEIEHLKALKIQSTEEKGPILGMIDTLAKATRKDVAYRDYMFCSVMTQKNKLLSIGALKIVIPLGD